MNEKELQQYLLLNYPKEDERCDWKEFKNLKNDSGKGVKHHDNIMITSGKHQESIRIRLTKNQDFILLALHRDPNLTIPELAEIVGIAGRNIAENLKKLQELGLLERVGSRKGGKWIVRN